MSNIWVRKIRVGTFEKDVVVGNVVLKGAAKIPNIIEAMSLIIEDAHAMGKKDLQAEMRNMLGLGDGE